MKTWSSTSLLLELEDCTGSISHFMVNSNDICALAKNPIVCSSGIGIDADTEKKINMCYLCQCSKAPLHLWYWLAEPWYQKHVDCVDYNGQNLLVITDIHSKWVDAYTMKAPLLQIDVVLVPGDREINLPLEDACQNLSHPQTRQFLPSWTGCSIFNWNLISNVAVSVLLTLSIIHTHTHTHIY